MMARRKRTKQKRKKISFKLGVSKRRKHQKTGRRRSLKTILTASWIWTIVFSITFVSDFTKKAADVASIALDTRRAAEYTYKPEPTLWVLKHDLMPMDEVGLMECQAYIVLSNDDGILGVIKFTPAPTQK